MATTWFCLIAFMLTTYVVLDGFDFGVGILHLFVAKEDIERRTVLAAIGPVWDGNEVWLVASGGVLVFSFPKVYAAAFSGFYLPFMMMLWVLILRGISIEFRSMQENALWRAFWDATFAVSSMILAFVLGVALGNVLRGLPLDGSGYFHMPLFTNFVPGSQPGALDWYTVSVGLFAVASLAAHGALYLLWKTGDAVAGRARRWAQGLWLLVLAMGAFVTVATQLVQPLHFHRLWARPGAWIFPPLIAGSLAVVFWALHRRHELPAFLASTTFLASLLCATATSLYPSLLPSSLAADYNLTVDNSASGPFGLLYGLVWWIPAIVLAGIYFWILFRSFRGKVSAGPSGHGY